MHVGVPIVAPKLAIARGAIGVASDLVARATCDHMGHKASVFPRFRSAVAAVNLRIALFTDESTEQQLERALDAAEGTWTFGGQDYSAQSIDLALRHLGRGRDADRFWSDYAERYRMEAGPTPGRINKVSELVFAPTLSAPRGAGPVKDTN